MGRNVFAIDGEADRRDAGTFAWWVIATLVVSVIVSVACLFWLDRPAPAPVQHRPASWVPAPTHRERAFAILEQPQGGRP